MIFYALFILDSVTRWYLPFKMVLYDYPLCWLLASLLSLAHYGAQYISDHSTLGGIVSYGVLYFMMVPLFVMFLINLYNKRVHEHYEDYV